MLDQSCALLSPVSSCRQTSWFCTGETTSGATALGSRGAAGETRKCVQGSRLGVSVTELKGTAGRCQGWSFHTPECAEQMPFARAAVDSEMATSC